MKLVPKYQNDNKTKYAVKDANTGEFYDIYLQDGNTYDSQGNPVSIIRTPDTVITPNTYNQQLASKSYGTKEKGLETVYPEFDLITGAGLAKDVGLFGLSKLGNKWAKNKLLDSYIKNITKNLDNPTIGFQEVPLEDGFVYRTFTPSEILNTPIANNYSYLKNTYTGFKGIKPKLNHHLQGDDAVKMFKEYGGTPIPEGSLNGDQLRKYVMEARERYGLIDNPNISDEEIAQALYKHTNELGKGSAAVNSQGEPQLLFRGDTKAYTQLKDRPSPTDLATKSGTMDNSLGTLFLGELPGTGQHGIRKIFSKGLGIQG